MLPSMSKNYHDWNMWNVRDWMLANDLGGFAPFLISQGIDGSDVANITMKSLSECDQPVRANQLLLNAV